MGMAKKSTHAARVRLPITIPILRKVLRLFDIANANLCAADRTAYKAALTNATYGRLRVGEITSPTMARRGGKEMTAADVTAIRDAQGPDTVTYNQVVKASKCDKFRQTATISLHANGSDTCPVHHLAKWLEVRRALGHSTDLPLYTLSGGKYLTRGAFTKALRAALDLAGYNSKLYGSHSCRGGGAVSLLSAGASTATIRCLGRWASMTFLGYLQHIPQGLAADLSARVANQQESDITSKHHELYSQRFDA